MRIEPLLMMAMVVMSTPALAQGTQQNLYGSQSYRTQSRTPVATRPSNNPFRNPIGQGVPPAASANSNLNSNRTNSSR